MKKNALKDANTAHWL